jgi:DNA-directed RNA polymerase subunit E'/Rpb7
MTSPYVVKKLLTLVELQPHQMNSDIYTNLKESLTNRILGKCITEGFVCKIYKISKYEEGEIVAENFNATSIHNVTYTARICNPTHGSIITMKIKEINKAIIEARNGPIQAILEINKHNPNNFFINSYGDICYKLKSGEKKRGKVLDKDDYIKISVTLKKYDLNDDSILIIGTIDDMATDDEIKEMEEDSNIARQDIFIDPTKVNKNIDETDDEMSSEPDTDTDTESDDYSEPNAVDV